MVIRLTPSPLTVHVVYEWPLSLLRSWYLKRICSSLWSTFHEASTNRLHPIQDEKSNFLAFELNEKWSLLWLGCYDNTKKTLWLAYLKFPISYIFFSFFKNLIYTKKSFQMKKVLIRVIITCLKRIILYKTYQSPFLLSVLICTSKNYSL